MSGKPPLESLKTCPGLGWRGKGKRGLTESQGREEKRESGDKQREGVWMLREELRDGGIRDDRKHHTHTHTSPHLHTASPTSQQDPIQ